MIVGKQNGGPRVRALAAPDDPTIHGIVSTYAKSLGGTNDARWTPNRTAAGHRGVDVRSRRRRHRRTVPLPTRRRWATRRVTRTPADDRYLSAITDRRTEANAIFNQMPGTPDAGYTRYTSVGGDCNLGAETPT